MDLNSTDNNKTAISPECLFMVIWKVTPQFRGYHQHGKYMTITIPSYNRLISFICRCTRVPEVHARPTKH